VKIQGYRRRRRDERGWIKAREFTEQAGDRVGGLALANVYKSSEAADEGDPAANAGFGSNQVADLQIHL